MPKIDLLDINGKKIKSMDLPKEIFGVKINSALMAQAVRVYLSNRRVARAKTKTRAEINRTKAKWYRQKGTGRARHGSRAASVFVGGGIAHGPTGRENFKLKMPEKMCRRALFSALTEKFKNKKILVVDGLEKIKPKTKEIIEFFEKLKIKGKNLKVLIVLPEEITNIVRAARNIEGISLLLVNVLNPYTVLTHEKIIFMKESVEKLKKTFLRK